MLEDFLSGSGMEKGRLQSPFTNLSSSSLISFLFPLCSVKDCTCTKGIGTREYTRQKMATRSNKFYLMHTLAILRLIIHPTASDFTRA